MNSCASGMIGDIVSLVGGIWNGLGVLVGGGLDGGIREGVDCGLQLYCCSVIFPVGGGT